MPDRQSSKTCRETGGILGEPQIDPLIAAGEDAKVPARCIVSMRLKPGLRHAFAAGPPLILSRVEPKHSRISAVQADARNREEAIGRVCGIARALASGGPF
jgi:hypothetical protein